MEMMKEYAIAGEYNGAKLHDALKAAGIPVASIVCDYVSIGAPKGTNVKVIVQQDEKDDFSAKINKIAATMYGEIT